MFVRCGRSQAAGRSLLMMRSTMASLSLRLGNIELLIVGLSA